MKKVRVVQPQQPDREPSEYDKDVWDIRNLGIASTPAKYDYKFNFSTIMQPWLRSALKKFTKYRLAILAVGTCQKQLHSVKPFSNFLANYYPNLYPSQINRSVIIEYLSYLAERGYTVDTRAQYISHLKVFLESCALNQWADLPQTTLIHKGDCPKIPEHQPRFMPIEVLEQLNQSLDSLPLPFTRMILVIQVNN